jgi:hypothetical protein
MGRKRKANLEVEYELERQIKDLKQEVAKLKKLLKEKEKDVKITKPEKFVKKVIERECPKCGASVKTTELPMGYLDLCESACGYRSVRKK